MLTNNPNLFVHFEHHALSGQKIKFSYGRKPIWRQQILPLFDYNYNPEQLEVICGPSRIFHQFGNNESQNFTSYSLCPNNKVYIEVGGIEAPSFSLWAIGTDPFFTDTARHINLQEFLFLLLSLSLLILLIFYRVNRVLGKATKSIQSIQPGQVADTITLEHIPQEFIPMVTAFNQAISRLERAYQKQKVFAGAAAHELKTPLTILQARLAQLPEGELKSELKGDIKRMSSLVQQLLKLPALSHLDRHFTQIDLVILTKEVIAQFAPQAITLGVELALKSNCKTLVVNGDIDAFKLALGNLIDNAIFYSAKN